MEIFNLARVSLADCDLRDINNLLKQLTDKAKPYNYYDVKRIARQRKVFVHVAMDGLKNEIIGMATMMIDDSRIFTRNYKTAYLEDVVVDVNYRRQRIGEKLIHSLIAIAKSLDVEYVSLTSNPNNPNRASAIRLYEKIGFKKIGELNSSNYYRLVL